MPNVENQSEAVQKLLLELRTFTLPGGEEQARRVARVRLTEKGEIRSAPAARWIPFTAEEIIEARRSGFVWNARLRAGKVVPMLVTDAYEKGHGRLVVKIGGAIPVVNSHGPDFDKGELQRYLASISLCPPLLVSHPTLEWTALGDRRLRVRDTEDPTAATVDIEIGGDGRLLGTRAGRPRVVGKRTVLGPWSATGSDYREWEGFRITSAFEAAWHLPDGVFTYFRGEVVSLVAER